MKVTDKYVLFWGDYLGNWTRLSKPIGYWDKYWQGPDHLDANGKKVAFLARNFITPEHMFMYLKATFFKDFETADKIAELAKDPKSAKSLGRRVKNFSEDRWREVREQAMFTTLVDRTYVDSKFKNLLLTPEWERLGFVEASPYDKIWGIGLNEDDPRALDSGLWLGQNLLGKCLDEARRYIKFVNFVGTFEEHAFFEEMLWCPSQIEYYFTDHETGKMYVVYMRWRHDDPWTIELIETDPAQPKSWADKTYGAEEYLDLGFFKDSDYRMMEDAVVRYLKDRFPNAGIPDTVVSKNIDDWSGLKFVDCGFYT